MIFIVEMVERDQYPILFRQIKFKNNNKKRENNKNAFLTNA